MGIFKKQSDIDKLTEAGRIVALVHRELKQHIKPGVDLLTLDKIAYDIIKENDATPAFLGLYDFPNSICASVNSTLVHGIPTSYKLQEGDVLSVDVGVDYKGFKGDAAFTIGVGNISDKDKLLLDCSKRALEAGIAAATIGNTIGDIGSEIYRVIASYGFSTPHQYSGHGIGKNIHEDPYVPNTGIAGQGEKLKEGMAICIEPMVIDGTDDLFTDPIDE